MSESPMTEERLAKIRVQTNAYAQTISSEIGSDLVAEIDRLRAANKLLAEVIKKAPCVLNCRNRKRLPFGDTARAEFDGTCNCWKSAVEPALAALRSAKEQG